MAFPSRVLRTTLRPMLSHQSTLPRLPVPPLTTTLTTYLNTLKPILSSQEYMASKKRVDAFRDSQEGNMLQARLEARKEKEENWLSEWWNDVAYFAYRDPTPINVSYFFTYKEPLHRGTLSQARYAAEIVEAAWEFRNDVVDGVLEVEKTKAGPLCMASYEWMFHTCRMPGKEVDGSVVYPGKEGEYVVVMRRNRFFKVEMRHPSGRWLTADEVELQMERILEETRDFGTPYGILTSTDRDAWYRNHAKLVSLDPSHAAHLHTIQSSAFMICLDESAPETRLDLSKACWHGEGANRWFDKSMQFIVFANGRAGVLNEHSRMDGMVTLRLNDFICAKISKGSHARTTLTDAALLPPPPELAFAAPDASLANALELAHVQFGQLVSSQSHHLAALPYGATVIKSLNASPDAYVQMVIQLAYRKVHGINRPTYESAQTRKYLLGRTETRRVVTEASVAWCDAMMKDTASTMEKAGLGRKALEAQVKGMADAVNGYGVDRHMLGLKKCILPGETMPEVFQDPAFAYSCHWFLSTSQLSSEYFDGYGWGEVVPDGYGIAYMIQKDAVCFNVAARVGVGAEKMAEALVWAGAQCRGIYEAEAALSGTSIKAKL